MSHSDEEYDDLRRQMEGWRDRYYRMREMYYDSQRRLKLALDLLRKNGK